MTGHIGSLMGRAHDVFISYSSKDKPVADATVAVLEANGIRCWIAPRDIRPGADWSARQPLRREGTDSKAAITI